jgi:hypothetical protein
MKGGSKGLLQNSENICGSRAKTTALAHFLGQIGKVYDTTPVLANSCEKTKKHGKGQKHRGAR